MATTKLIHSYEHDETSGAPLRAEAEALAIRFTIDHYEPQRSRGDLVNEYSNLMYCCDECNQRKGDRTPPADARSQLIRFFRPDVDYFDDHFELDGVRLKPASPTGDYTIEAIDLNRPMLRKLRELRTRQYAAQQAVAAGVRGLQSIPLDQLPKDFRGRAAVAMAKAEVAASDLGHELDELLRNHARSPLIDLPPDPEEVQKERAERLKAFKALAPSAPWRARDIQPVAEEVQRPSQSDPQAGV